MSYIDLVNDLLIFIMIFCTTEKYHLMLEKKQEALYNEIYDLWQKFRYLEVDRT